jgi:hypothetical protein
MAWMVPIMAAQQQEEENRLLAELIAQDTQDRNEFKILHGGPGAFRSAERMQKVLEEEGQAQWTLAAKLDSERLILRRPREARTRDVLRGPSIDPYRTRLGGTAPKQLVLLIIFLVGAGIAGLGLVGTFGSGDGWSVALIGITVLLLGLIVAIKSRR